MTQDIIIADLINRLARLDAASAWNVDLNPAQRAVLGYLARANRFSRSPSQVADYLGSTRGTVSQTCKSLVQKGFLTERRSTEDKRVISFDLTTKGTDALAEHSQLQAALARLTSAETSALSDALQDVLKSILAKNDGRPFGVCKTCRHHETRKTGGYCQLLAVPLEPAETEQICHEQDSP